MSIGNNTTDFKVYKTIDGGAHWTIQFTNEDPNAFYDCFAFWTPDRGITHSDSGNGVFPDIRTKNGNTWESISANMPPVLPGEPSFAASGTCIAAEGKTNAWITTGGSTIARILASRGGGNTWNAYDTPLLSSPSAGGVSVAFRDSRQESSAAATCLQTPAPRPQPLTMAAGHGLLPTHHPCREPFSAWPMSAARSIAMMKAGAGSLSILSVPL
jgi:photosystem II stability/assembly factor-like uncharacterized protein